MVNKRTRQVGPWIAIGLFTLLCGPTSAQTYPVRPVKLVIGLSAGGTADATARLLVCDESIKTGKAGDRIALERLVLELQFRDLAVFTVDLGFATFHEDLLGMLRAIDT